MISVEFCERFSFYAMLSILALFLADRPANDGFGWTAANALALVGIYSGSMYALPALGGYLADRFLGYRRAVAIGASWMFVGQVLLLSPRFLPALLGEWYGLPLADALRSLDVPLGEVFPSHAVLASIATRGHALDPVAGAHALKVAYVAGAWGFYAALGSLIAGNALMKSTLVILCGETFPANDPRRDGAYAYYYLGISVGAMLSGFVVGSVSQRFGWYPGFATGSIGMAAALGLYVFLSGRWLGDVGNRPRLPASAGTTVPSAISLSSPDVRRRAGLVLVVALVLSAFCVGWFQMFGSWSLFIERSVDRTLGALVVPVPWFSSINAAFVIAVAPAIGALWVRLGASQRRVDIVQKYSFALAIVALAHVLMYGAARLAAHGVPAPLWVPTAGVILLGLGEVVAWTATYGFVYEAAPAGLASLTMGIWYLLTLGLGGYASGYTGGWVDRYGFPFTFATIAIAMTVALGISLLLRRSLLRLAARSNVTL